MAKSIQQIQQELETLESNVAETSQELQAAYAQYLELLSQSAKQQLILASYQLCTKIYPESFLSLSLSEKQKLQQKLRTLGNEIQPIIINCGVKEGVLPVRRELDLLAEMLENLPLTAVSKEQPPSNLELSSPREGEAEIAEIGEKAALESPLFNKLASLAETLGEDSEELETSDSHSSLTDDSGDRITTDSDIEKIETAAEIPLSEQDLDVPPQPPEKLDFNNPEHLLIWHKQVERKIKKALEELSVNANKCLQAAKIISSRLPTKIIEVAIQAEEAGASSGDRRIKNLPNILSLVIETDKEKKSKPSSIEQIDLLRLSLLEIEFADTMLNVRRNKVRSVIDKIAKLQRRYQQLKKDYTIAEAEAAWRSSWYED